MPGPPCPECVTTIRQHLLDQAAEHYTLADRLYARRNTRGNARVARRMAVAYGWAAGQLRDLATR